MRASIVSFIVALATSLCSAQWVQTNGPYGADVRALTVHGNNLFAATAGGVFRSMDNGAGWQPSNAGLTGTGATAFASSGTKLFARTSGGGVFLSTNNGTSWTSVSNGLTGMAVSALSVSGTRIYAGGIDGVFLSTNDGGTWSAYNSGFRDWDHDVGALTVVGGNILAAAYRVYLSKAGATTWDSVFAFPIPQRGLPPRISSFAFDGTNVYAGSTGGGVLRSTDGGVTWFVVDSGLTYNGHYVSSLALFGSNIFAGTGGGVFLSTNNGATWIETNTGLPKHYDRYPDIQCLAVSGMDLIAGTPDGVFVFPIGGNSWSQANIGLTNTYVGTIAVSGTTVYSGARFEVFRSTDNGFGWTNVHKHSGFIRTLAVSGTRLFCAGDGGVCLSTDDGSNWITTTNGLDTVDIYSIAVSPGSSSLFAGGPKGIFRSTDNGTSWTPVNSNFGNGYALSLASCGTALYAGTCGNGVYRSSDNGESWKPIGLASPSGREYDAGCFAFIDSFVFVGTNVGVFSTDNDGQSWDSISSGLTDGYVCSIAVSGKNLFAATFSDGIFVTTDYGTSWNPAGLQGFQTRSLAVSGPNLFAGTDGFGVWRRPLSEMVSSVQLQAGTMPDQFVLHQNYPNPFNPTTTISYQLPVVSFVALKVYNVLGQEVATLANAKQTPGTYTVTFDGSKLASGVYFYRLQAGKSVENKKMLLLK